VGRLDQVEMALFDQPQALARGLGVFGRQG
jgi:hypothetical protein